MQAHQGLKSDTARVLALLHPHPSATLMQDYLHLQVWLCRYSPSGAQAGQRLWPTSGTQLLILAAARIAPYIQLGKLASHTPGRPATGGQKAYTGRMGLRASSGPPDKHKSKYSRSNGSHHAPSNATCATWLCFSPSCLGASMHGPGRMHCNVS